MVLRSMGTLRQRLLDGLFAVAYEGGYTASNVSAVIAEAAVSRPTFYDFFADRDDCFVATIAYASERLMEAVAAALEDRPAAEALGATVEAVVAFASAEPAVARFLMSESMTGGPRALDARDDSLRRLAALVLEAQSGLGPEESVADVELGVLLGGMFRVLATRLRRGEPAISRVADDLLAWVASYARPASELRWGGLEPAPRAPRSPHVPDVPIQEMPSALPQGRPRLTEEQIAENHRLRILYATARMAERKGYSATTVSDISELAKLDKHVFYRLFSDKQDAFMSVHELGFQQVMEVTSSAFFSVSGWPERSWEGGRALTGLLEANPLVAHVGFVEAHAVGPGAVQRIEDSHVAFMFFLQEGLVYRRQEAPPSRIAMEAIITTIFEIVYRQSRLAGTPDVAPMLPHIAHIWLTPFLGSEDADAFIDGRSAAPAAKRRRRRAPART